VQAVQAVRGSDSVALLTAHGVQAVTFKPPAEMEPAGHVTLPVDDVALKKVPGAEMGTQKLASDAPAAGVAKPAAQATVTSSAPPLAAEPGQKGPLGQGAHTPLALSNQPGGTAPGAQTVKLA